MKRCWKPSSAVCKPDDPTIGQLQRALDSELSEEALDQMAGGTNYYRGTAFCNLAPPPSIGSGNCRVSYGASGGISYACHSWTIPHWLVELLCVGSAPPQPLRLSLAD